VSSEDEGQAKAEEEAEAEEEEEAAEQGEEEADAEAEAEVEEAAEEGEEEEEAEAEEEEAAEEGGYQRGHRWNMDPVPAPAPAPRWGWPAPQKVPRDVGIQWDRAWGGGRCDQGLTLVHISAQCKHILLHTLGVHDFPPVY
jgi:hypothetical protein